MEMNRENYKNEYLQKVQRGTIQGGVQFQKLGLIKPFKQYHSTWYHTRVWQNSRKYGKQSQLMEHKKCDQIIYWIHYHGYAVVLYTSLTECGCRVFPSQQNFVDQSKICGV